MSSTLSGLDDLLRDGRKAIDQDESYTLWRAVSQADAVYEGHVKRLHASARAEYRSALLGVIKDLVFRAINQGRERLVESIIENQYAGRVLPYFLTGVGDLDLLKYLFELSPRGMNPYFNLDILANDAAAGGHASVLRYLLDRGASAPEASLGALPRAEQAKLWWYAYRGSPEVRDRLPSRFLRKMGPSFHSEALGAVLPATLVRYLSRAL